jgi:hypothetical protein
MAVPSRPAPTLPPDEAQLESWLNIHSVDWSTPAGNPSCILFVRISLQHWARLALDRNRVAELVAEGAAPPPGSWLSLSYSAEDFLDDDDHDGDPLDPGELSTAPGGTEAKLICRNPAAQGS